MADGLQMEFFKFVMKKMNFLKLSLPAFMLLAMISCNNEPLATDNPSGADESFDMLKADKKLENPYTVLNMKKAFEAIKPKMVNSQFAKNASDFDIETSHRYVKIMPANEEQESLMKSD